VLGPVISNLCFSFGGSTGHPVHFGASGMGDPDALFFMHGWVKCGFDKKRVGTIYTKLLFLHLLGYVGHILCSGVSDT
jgi:hypothetical protein